jgi:hypothetical protein
MGIGTVWYFTLSVDLEQKRVDTCNEQRNRSKSEWVMTYNEINEDEKDKGGRPPRVFDFDEIAQVESLAAVLSVEMMADYFGIAKPTFYAIMERQPEVFERYKRGKARAIGTVAKALITKAQSGDTASMIFYLKTQAGWKETQVVDSISSDRSMSPRDMTDEELKAEREKYGIPEPE